MHIPKKVPNVLRPFLTPTQLERTPTDEVLDRDIEYASILMHAAWPVMRRIFWNKVRRFFVYRWKYILARLVFTAMLIALGYIAFIKVFDARIEYVKQQQKQEDVMLSYPSDTSMNLHNYLKQIAYMESRYDPSAHRDSSQFWGLYQLGIDARRVAGYSDIPYSVFVKHPDIQNLAMLNFLKYNKAQMQKYIDKYSGQVIDGILATESGILALAHLGCGFAQECLDKGIVPTTDKYGNSPRLYFKLGGYNLNLDKPIF